MEKMESSEMRNLMEIRDTQNSILTMQEALLEQMLPAPSSGSGTELVLDMVAPPVVSASQRAPSPSLAKFEAARSASISQYSSMIGLQSFGKSLNVSNGASSGGKTSRHCVNKVSGKAKNRRVLENKFKKKGWKKKKKNKGKLKECAQSQMVNGAAADNKKKVGVQP
ncbi:uncharacterized protein LOC124155859 isoform X1 [Ischnura elegans]|uniref:uncharacterized protein LOC124155859 isoform X1 n=1 Tax=Ischnura elegans TaxID=197161 RepID=UPI001ED87636|nr:uncharacterized protein LOC124155859 isoform X1 [Ischnura elegans]